MIMMRFIREIVRKVLGSRSSEPIIDTWDRKKKNLARMYSHKNYTNDEFSALLDRLGIHKGDYVFLHSSLRSFFEFPNLNEHTIIEIILGKIGDTGVLMMPGSGRSHSYFDVNHTVSTSGKISQTFTTIPGVSRSLDAYFSVSYFSGKKSNYIDHHIDSINPFDEHSPFEDLLQNKGKILCLGIGKYPIKLSFIHYITYQLFENGTEYVSTFNKHLETTIVTGNHHKLLKKILVRNDSFQNNNIVIRQIAKNTRHVYQKCGFLKGYCCNANDLLTEATNSKKFKGKIYVQRKMRGRHE